MANTSTTPAQVATVENKSLKDLSLKELINMALSTKVITEYTFQKKQELISLLEGSTANTLSEEVSKPKVKKEKVVKVTAPVEMPEPDAPVVSDVVEDKPAKAEPKPSKSGKSPAKSKAKESKAKPAKAKDAKKSEIKQEPKKSSKKSEDASGAIEALMNRADIKEYMESKDKDGNERTKSDKIRFLVFKAKPAVTVGQAAKMVGIHYSFAYCVVDTWRKQHVKNGNK